MGMNFVLLGAPGAGKGTQAKLISKKYSLVHLSTGDMFREAEVGSAIADFLAQGKLVPDELVINMVRERLKRNDVKNGFLLDGFPRTLDQARALDDMLSESGKKVSGVIYIEVLKDEVVKRLSGRRVCGACGASYHVTFAPPKVSGKCDTCGAPLNQRKDDNPDTVLERLEIYNKQTFPLTEYYAKAGVLVKINGAMSESEVFAQISSFIDATVFKGL
jgi:adenylate kinase